VLESAAAIAASLAEVTQDTIDDRDQMRPGWKYAEWEARGVPVRIEVGPKDVAKGQAVLVRRDNRKKEFVPVTSIPQTLREVHAAMQSDLFERALRFREERTRPVDSYEDFRAWMEASSGFALAHWCGDGTCEAQVKEETKATIRAIPLQTLSGAAHEDAGACVHCGRPSSRRVVWAVAY
jgi:prolyl-tRNA synthetase